MNHAASLVTRIMRQKLLFSIIYIVLCDVSSRCGQQVWSETMFGDFQKGVFVLPCKQHRSFAQRLSRDRINQISPATQVTRSWFDKLTTNGSGCLLAKVTGKEECPDSSRNISGQQTSTYSIKTVSACFFWWVAGDSNSEPTD